MFIEPYFQGERRGWIEVITGSMFSGKTEELIRRLKRATIGHLQVRNFKPSVDLRYHGEKIVSHDDHSILSTPVDKAADIAELSPGVTVIGIDEAQFFDEGLVQVAQTLASLGSRVIIAGLDMDYQGRPFGVMPQLMAISDYITKLHAVCVVCGNIANFSYRKTTSGEQVLLGDENEYEPRCRLCFNLGTKANDSIPAL